MKIIGVLFGVENSFPSALVERINNRNPPGIQAEFVRTGAVYLHQTPRYAVILDRISHDIPFYRAFLKHAALNGTTIVNNPFWCSADDKFLNYTLAARLGVAVPPTALLPHKEYPNGTSGKVAAQSRVPAGLGQRACCDRRPRLSEADPRRRLARRARVPRPRRVLSRLRSIARPLHGRPESHRFHGVFSLLRSGIEKGSHHALRSATAPRRALPARRSRAPKLCAPNCSIAAWRRTLSSSAAPWATT